MDLTRPTVSLTIALLVCLNLYLMKVINHLENEQSDSLKSDYPSPSPTAKVITDKKWAEERKKLKLCYTSKALMVKENSMFKNRLDGLLTQIRGKGAGNTKIKKQADPLWISQAKKDGKIPTDTSDSAADSVDKTEKTNEQKKPDYENVDSLTDNFETNNVTQKTVFYTAKNSTENATRKSQIDDKKLGSEKSTSVETNGEKVESMMKEGRIDGEKLKILIGNNMVTTN